MRKMAAIASLVMTAAVLTSHASAQTSVSLEDDIGSVVSDVLRLDGKVTLAGATAALKVDSIYRPGAIFSVPVAFARTGHLSHDVHASTGYTVGWDNDVVIPAGTPVYHTTFYRHATASVPLDAWCANHSYTRGVFHDKTSYGMYCIAKTKDGKAVGFYAGSSKPYLGGSDYYPDKPQWFAFSLSGGHSLPFDDPGIVEDTAPSPSMTLSLKLEASDDSLAAYLTLSGPAGYDPQIGAGWRVPATNVGGHILVFLGEHTVSMDYNASTKTVSNVQVAEGIQPDLVDIGQPLYYWLDYQLGAAGGQQPVDDTPWQFGAEYVKPETLTISNGRLAKNDALLTASAQLGTRYRLQSPLAAWVHNAGAAAGAFVYQASDTHRSADGTLYRNDYWCVEAPAGEAQCVPAAFGQSPGGQGRAAWQLSPLSLDVYEGSYVTPYQPEYLNVGYRPIDAVPDPDTSPSTATVQMRVTDIEQGYVVVTLGLLQGQTFQAARAYSLPFDAQGDAVLSLWTKRIRLHHDGKMVSVTGTEDGDGEGPQLDNSHVWEVSK